ncbi:MAG TPA: thioesterase family protein [Myxococcota bacterium]|nr:thioesterase family protein [Myxococcota bacterium]
MSPEVFRRTRTIAPGDIDELGHVNNVRWLRFVAELATAHAQLHGSDLAALRAQGALWIVRRHEIDYHRPALPGEEIVEETWVEAMTGAKSERHSRFTRASDGTLLVLAVTTWAYVDAKTLRPTRIPEALRARFVRR